MTLWKYMPYGMLPKQTKGCLHIYSIAVHCQATGASCNQAKKMVQRLIRLLCAGQKGKSWHETADLSSELQHTTGGLSSVSQLWTYHCSCSDIPWPRSLALCLRLLGLYSVYILERLHKCSVSPESSLFTPVFATVMAHSMAAFRGHQMVNDWQ